MIETHSRYATTDNHVLETLLRHRSIREKVMQKIRMKLDELYQSVATRLLLVEHI